MAEEEQVSSSSSSSSWSLESGGYLGEVSALCFVHVPLHISPYPFLLVGSGSQILLYDVELGRLLRSFQVFKGIRVHGISCSSVDVLSSTLTSIIVVFGEKIVKLFNLRVRMPLGTQNRSNIIAELVPNHILPRFSHWVMDVLFVKEDHMSSDYKGSTYLAVGLGENSVCLWDISRSTIAIKIRCPEMTLLYSMRLWGNTIKSLRVASGTIYNEVIVWKLVSRRDNSSHKSSLVSNSNEGFLSIEKILNDQQYEAIYLNKLVAHEGSIFRLAWSPDGSKLISASDDRSAHVWNIDGVIKDSVNRSDVDDSDSVGLVLFGHGARVWDCYVSDSLLITAGEDCTCRAWGMDGKQLLLIKEHSGRGIWRCTYDPSSSLLITAGFDSSVKVHMLHTSLSMCTVDQNRMSVGLEERMEVFTLSVPNLSDRHEPLNSKSEYVRCLHFTREDTIYVATNNGYLYHIKLSDATDVKWTELACISNNAPIVCMDLLSRDQSNSCKVAEDWITVGDGKGNVTIVRVVAGVSTSIAGLVFTWSAGLERQLLGTYWCKSLGPSYIFTADPRGILKLWKIHGPLLSGCEQTTETIEALLIAEFTSIFGTRITCLDLSLDEQVLVCGDQRGNLVIFSLSRGLLASPIASKMKISPINSFKGAHGISSVTSISVSATSLSQVVIRSTGGDGCICYFKYSGDWKSLEFTGMKQVKELSLIQSVSSDEDLALGSYAVGFSSAEFIIWNLRNEIKVVQVSCGGWRRPHSYYLGDVPESRNCFAFVKDHAIHIHRLWVPDSEKNVVPHVLHMQYHGREIHSLCFVSDVLHSSSAGDILLDTFSCIATGCEGGTVRLTRYGNDCQNWFASKLLGEHVGGSAVRSLCFVSKIYTTALDGTYLFKNQHGSDGASNEMTNPSLLISVGAKRVLTSWRLQKRRLSNYTGAVSVEKCIESENSFDHSQGVLPSMSFQWLSTDMPSKFSSTHKIMKNREKGMGRGKNVTNVKTNPTSNTCVAEENELESNSFPVDKNENDWRYLAVTAFLVKGADCRSIVCFIVVSCSDATVTLRALILPYRLWFDVALLAPQTAPVLSLQNVILPISSPLQDNLQVGGVYLVISGSTDGSICFWDLTESVERFMQRLSKIQPENYIDCQTRPRTGRGSQGGRWWRTLHDRFSKTCPEGTMGTEDRDNTNYEHKTNGLMNSNVNCGKDSAAVPYSEEYAENPSNDNCEIRPFHVLNNIHQSGVNCLHVSTISNCDNTKSVSAYCVLSGGDDQALHCLIFELSPQKIDDGSNHADYCESANFITDLPNMFKACLKYQRCRIRFLSHDRVASAHSSALKGVWTDGSWAFSTGLDQRVRCWQIEEKGKLREQAHLVISVTEPEALDARACGRNQYQIAVAGRGVQMVNFSASHHDGDGCGQKPLPTLSL